MKLIYDNLSLKASALFTGLLISALCMYATDMKAQGNKVLYRVNAGGAQINDNPISWAADQSETSAHGTTKKGTPSPYLTLTNPKTEDLTYGIAPFTGSNTTGYPDELFTTERFSTSRYKVSQTWDFPVSVAGIYTVKLLFAEIWEGAQAPGDRVFGIAIEENIVKEALDLTAEAGWNVALVKTYKVEVNDGNLDINLLRNTQNPAIKGIEIIGPAGANVNLPPRFASFPVVRGEAGETLEATFTTIEKDGDAIALEIIIKDQNGNTVTPSTYNFTDHGDGTGSLQWETQETDIFVYHATLTATDKDGSISKKFNITISEKVKDILYRVNAGGMELKDFSDPQRPSFSADTESTPSEYVAGGQTYYTNNLVTADASVPAYVPFSLFQTERFQRNVDEEQMQWAFPVSEGKTVNVRIYLSEIFLTAEGANSNKNKGPRIFDVIMNEDTVEKAIDVFSEVGENVGIMRSYYVTSHGSVDISLNAIFENPSVKGIEIIEVEPLKAKITTKDAVCFGGHGSATVEVTGGIGPYEIIWEDGITPNQLLAGTYSLTVKDAGGQKELKKVTIHQPEALNIIIDTENATTAGESNGKASATVSGGKGPYEYAWGEGVNPDALSAGNYILTVMDANGCSASDSFIIGSPETLVVNVKAKNSPCFGGTGSAEVIVAGGIAPYETVWKDGADPAALPAGDYTVTVTDNNGKQIEKQVTITQPTTDMKVKVNTIDASAFGASDGSVSLAVSGGTSPYNIFWGSVTPNALSAGTYAIRVKDAAGCEKELEIVIGQPKELTAEITPVGATCDEAGSAMLDIQGGTFPYNVNWSHQANPDSLSAGKYQVVITDANDVRLIKDVEIILDCDAPLSTDDPAAENLQLKIYPVPGDDVLNISVPASVADKEGVIRVYTTYGQKILEQHVNTFHLGTINVGHLSKGTYILEVTTKNNVLKSRFLLK